MNNEFDKIKKSIVDKQNLQKKVNHKYNYVGKLNSGLKPFQNALNEAEGGLYGYLDVNDKVVVEAKFIDAKMFSNGLAPVGKMMVNKTIIDSLDRPKSILNRLLKIVVNDSNLDEQKTSISKELKYGYIDVHENLIIDFSFDEAFSFSEGFAVVRKSKDWLLIDQRNHIISDINADRVVFPCILKNSQLSVLIKGEVVQLDFSNLLS